VQEGKEGWTDCVELDAGERVVGRGGREAAVDEGDEAVEGDEVVHAL